MTKSIISAFFIILILGMMVNEIEGQQQQQRCEEALTEIDCGAGNCNALCLQKRKGLGRCVQRTPCDKLKCMCYYPCSS
ncbi:low-molecular-weight cysteine-rich 3 [Arabidopsis thaliana]|uniref:Defensin-like protein 141 n=2 Tax=Arabidopsis thaliana TaxID=3702 RepID=DF141_ARATH|nr:low-molecular-weight cysteine-rich 3 [Arabidopsis thaliana]P82718.1 RecName: Full=Defensin-like protein 141; AltName: Full=Low-molecular-weight cysteine-rich protein 3; Short=Protein LCR3; Flags: Precursor [Arabidopsis thaliana]AED95479.1 low-molecular-weight cysteine-rich 3 [Arabidopsis thaliana]CAA0408157.1 unnamed protein product [Arabidopsis thaliana]|eukprot:NP_001032027.1 low-molecular-weight cysteine-rich 3 [Arabidopsis thaliana]